MAVKTICCKECEYWDDELKGIAQAQKSLLEREHNIRKELQHNAIKHSREQKT